MLLIKWTTEAGSRLRDALSHAGFSSIVVGCGFISIVRFWRLIQRTFVSGKGEINAGPSTSLRYGQEDSISDNNIVH